MTDVSRRNILAWAVPAVAVAVAAPLASASGPSLYCTSGDGDVKDVQVRGNVLYITFTDTAQNAVDVTVRQQGYGQIHFNFVTENTPTNGVPHMRNYKRGETIAIPLHREYNLASDWMQVKTIHNENCVVVG